MAEGLYELYNCVFDGSISGYNYIDRRPYHKNCGCPLHELRGGCPHQRSVQVSYSMRRSWSEGTLCLATNSTAASTVIQSPPPLFQLGQHLDNM